MNIRDDSSFLEDALQYATRETRHHVTDALACSLHNDGYSLQGNTEANDVEWFARNLWERRLDSAYATGCWDTAPAEMKANWRQIARTVIAVLPGYQLRVAHRLITLSKVVRDIERAERRQRETYRVASTPIPAEPSGE